MLVISDYQCAVNAFSTILWDLSINPQSRHPDLGTQKRRNSVPGYLLFPTGVELSSRAIASSSQGGTEFRLPTSDDCTIKRSCYKLQLLTNKNIVKRKIGCYNIAQGNQSKAACPLRRVLPSRRKKGGLPMITYSDLIQFCIFVVSLISLIRQIYEDKRK